MPLPYVVKPVNEGSSVGVEIVRNGDNRRAEIARAWRFGPSALVEEYVPGRELTVGVMGDRALAVTEILAVANDFYDYECEIRRRRVAPRHSGRRSPRRLCTRAWMSRSRRIGRWAAAALRGAISVTTTPSGEPGRLVLLEINTQPGLTPTSLLPEQAAHLGMSFPQLVRLDGGERRMPRVRHGPRNSVTDRPPGWRLLLRRQRSMVGPLARIVLASIAVVLLVILGRSAMSGGTSGSTLATMRERIGSATAASGLRVTQVLINGRANTPEPLLRARHRRQPGRPYSGLLAGAGPRKDRDVVMGGTCDGGASPARYRYGFAAGAAAVRDLAESGKYLLVDRAGQVVADQDVAQFRRLPLIVGRGAPLAAAELLDALSDRPALAEKVLASVRVGERRWNLRMASGSDVMLPEGHEVAAIDRLMQLQQDHAVLDRPLAAIDLRLPDRLVLRPAPGSSDIDVTPPLPPGGPHPVALPPPTVPVVAKKPT